MGETRIRSARPEDAGALLEIYGYYVRHTAVSFEYEVPTAEVFRERIRQTLRRYPYLIAERDGRILGYAYAGPLKTRPAYDWACELSVYVDRGCRRQGLGRLLYEELARRLGAMGILDLYACVAWPPVEDEYLDRNSALFHEHMGFAVVGTFRESGYKFGRWYDMVWMRKNIGAHVPNQPPVRFPQPQA